MSDREKQAKRVLSVGQCFADHSGINRVLHGSFGADVVGADTQSEALNLLRQDSFDLVHPVCWTLGRSAPESGQTAFAARRLPLTGRGHTCLIFPR